MNSSGHSVDSHQHGRVRFFLFVIRALFRRLPISFYLALAIIGALVLGASGFRDLQNPKEIAFTMTLFVVFFGTVVYRALIEAFEMARSYRKENDDLITSVFDRDDFSSELGDRVAERESGTESTDI